MDSRINSKKYPDSGAGNTVYIYYWYFINSLNQRYFILKMDSEVRNDYIDLK